MYIYELFEKYGKNVVIREHRKSDNFLFDPFRILARDGEPKDSSCYIVETLDKKRNWHMNGYISDDYEVYITGE